ncbi:conserved hypothetical protein [Pediculus humanus corporis]|uniref:Uncharacterized protein n=1 Tax=Pediculus humanus subsp. corporis TaxID=121224 RepID=E0W0J0_PEDHC|nr:uncharacterized protein Phum_PHUM556440 [Pediculus humanus corporis]EEB19146.1 conserved hypothetical protein [Pediculus humanus corporis]
MSWSRRAFFFRTVRGGDMPPLYSSNNGPATTVPLSPRTPTGQYTCPTTTQEMEAWRDEWMDVVCGKFCVMGKFELPLSSI